MVRIVGYDSYYINENGDVFSSKKNGSLQKMSLNIKKNGYANINLWNGKKRKTFRIHRLVAKSFLKNDSNLQFVNHKDGNKLNNNVSNLEWCTPSQNTIHAISTGLRAKKTLRGSLDDFQILTIRTMSNISNDEMSKIYNVSNSLISQIRSNAIYSEQCLINDYKPKYFKRSSHTKLTKDQFFNVAISIENINLIAKKYGISKHRVCAIRKIYKDGYLFNWGKSHE